VDELFTPLYGLAGTTTLPLRDCGGVEFASADVGDEFVGAEFEVDDGDASAAVAGAEDVDDAASFEDGAAAIAADAVAGDDDAVEVPEDIEAIEDADPEDTADGIDCV